LVPLVTLIALLPPEPLVGHQSLDSSEALGFCQFLGGGLRWTDRWILGIETRHA
jgi:hypothetical protein